ncbi:MAG: TfoX/Sxy family protein [Planctomycetota bacterium]|jgi:DNA transformation protein
MPVSDEYLTYVIDQLECVGPVQARRMFGGAGLYFDGLFFALVADDVLYFKVDDSNRPDYESAGMGAFRPFDRGPRKQGHLIRLGPKSP